MDPSPWSSKFIEASREVVAPMSTPRTNLVRRCSRSGGVRLGASWVAYAWAASRKPPVPQAGSMTRSFTVGRTTSTTAWIRARGVKYWPAVDLVSPALRSSSSS
jgi:hypothetical protein